MSWNHTQCHKKTEDGELWITETERENDVFITYQQTFNSDTYVLLIDLNGGDFPHRLQGQNIDRVDITSICIFLDVAINSSANILFGVITRIDGTDADITYFLSTPYTVGSQAIDQMFQLKLTPSQIKLDMSNGVLQHGLSNLTESNVATVNTGTTLVSPDGNIIPDVGDLIMKYDHDGGSANTVVQVFYHTH